MLRLASSVVEMFTTSRIRVISPHHSSQRRLGLFRRLAIPGVIGAVSRAGAGVLTSIDASVAKPFVMAYLACIGIYLLYKAWGYTRAPRELKIIARC